MVIDEVRTVIGDALQLGSRAESMSGATRLLGAMPELDSMAVLGLITALEDHFGIQVADDDINAQTFATLGSVSSFVEQKLSP